MTYQRSSWLAACVTVAAVVAGAVVSCQQQGATEGRPQAARYVPSTAPAATQAAAEVVTQDMKQFGFTFPAAPSASRDPDAIDAMNRACVVCHTNTDDPKAPTHDSLSMHATTSVKIACVDCHGGNWQVASPDKIEAGTQAYENLKAATHVFPKRHPALWEDKDHKRSSANPQLLAMGSIDESVDFIRFVNPGDLRAARAACGGCHNQAPAFHVSHVQTSMMTHGSMLWEAALYNNGAIRLKNAVYGEQYAPAPGNPSVSVPAAVFNYPQPTPDQTRRRGVLPFLYPLPRWEITLPGNVLRVFERGAMFRPIVGIPESEEDPGRPDVKLSLRGFGTDVRTDPVFIGLQKTRLFDPTLDMFGTNDHPGDFRSSGCTACHVVYANDRSPVHSTAMWAAYGNRGESFNTDITVNPRRGALGPATQPYNDPYSTARPGRESGHPVKHTFVRNMPSSQCIVCHVHPGTNVLNSYLGYMWWDNETDGQFMYPKDQVYPTPEQEYEASQHNPENAAARGLWSDMYPDAVSHAGQRAGKDFLENLTKLNPQLKHTQFADFHGHGWVFRAVFKQDRHGNMLDYANQPVGQPTAQAMHEAVEYQWQKDGDHPPDHAPVHLKDIHLEMGMQCADCHFSQDEHGDGNLYGATRDPVMVTCEDCHGTVERPSRILRFLTKYAGSTDSAEAKKVAAHLFTGNGATARGSEDTWLDRNQRIIDKHFEVQDGKLIQKTAGSKDADGQGVPFRQWTVVQTVDTADPNSSWYTSKTSQADKDAAARARYAHTVRVDPQVWGTAPQPANGNGKPDSKTRPDLPLAHSSATMSCYACHSSWNTSCFGCHIPQRANQRKTMLHNEGVFTRNYTAYNYQTLRDDVYMLGVDSTTKDHKVVPIRSACAVLVSSQDALRQWIYTQQQTISAEGYSGQSFTAYFPHTVRATETKQCEDCHISRKGDNNAIMAQLLLQGTNSVNFIGRFAWVAEENEGLEAVVVTERDEPQAVIGSRLHELAYPDYYKQHMARGGRLAESHEHTGTVLDVQLRGEYLYAACGPNGFVAYDIANIDNKGFSERIITAPVSPLGQQFYVKSSYATSVCSPSTMALDPTRPSIDANEEGVITKLGDPSTVLQKKKIHPLYAYLYLTDRDEGLIVIGNPADDKRTGPGVVTLLDGNPDNNFLQRALTFNPGGLLKGARHMDLYGKWAYVSCDRGIVVLDMDDPLHPQVVSTPNLSGLRHPKKVAFQFRYGFVVDDDGIKVINVTNPADPFLVDGATRQIDDARDIYVMRTYGYVAAGRNGLRIIDLEAPEKPRPENDIIFNENGQMNDATAVRCGMTNASMFAYVADGRNGLKVLQLTSPDDVPTYLGFSPRPAPRLIAWYPTHGPAVSLSKGLDRDRAVDESGNQLSVFGRRGARPFTLEEQQMLYISRLNHKLYTVSNDEWAMSKPIEVQAPAPPPKAEPESTPTRRRPRPGGR